ncbi:Fe-S cluster assembly protein SufD [Actinopolymorpha singaporensis]|nr:Fe-S cluster assembly protein SufD [Actinopolymorpha singaporensis]
MRATPDMPDHDQTHTGAEAAQERAAVASQVLSPDTGAVAGPPPTPAGSAGQAHSHGAGADAQPASHLHPEGSFDLADHPVPTGREEVWRFTPLKRLRRLTDGSAEASGKVVVDVSAGPEVRVETVGRDDARLGSVHKPGDRVSAQAWTSFGQATVVTVPAEARPADPVVVTVRGEAAEGASYAHTFVDVQPYAEAVVVLDHVGSATYADNVELSVGDGAKVTLVSVQDWADDAVHAGHQALRIGRDAHVRHVVVTFGGDLVRLHSHLSYAGPGGEVEALGLYFADADQHLEHRLFVDHNQPHTRSNVEYKGALQGAGAHTVWVGDVLIRKVAEGIQTYEHNRNLMLTDGCRADSVPNLEIETGEIEGAGHASATGRFDDEQLFYLQSRGVPADEARRLVVHGFFADLIRHIGVPQLRERLMGHVEEELERSVGLPPASSTAVPASSGAAQEVGA